MTALDLALSQFDSLTHLGSLAHFAHDKGIQFLADDGPKINSVDPPAALKGGLMKLAGWLMWIATLACGAGVIITGVRIAVAFRGGGDANIVQLAWVLFACVLIGGASGIANAVL